MNKLFNILKTCKTLLPIFTISILLNIFLYFYIPKTMKNCFVFQNTLENSTNNTKKLSSPRIEYIYKARDEIIIASVALSVVLILIFSFFLLGREKKLDAKNKLLSDSLEGISKDFDKYVIASKADLKGIITYASTMFCEISGYTKEELVGKNQNIIRHPDMPSSVFEDMWSILQEDKIWSGEVKNIKKDGGYYWVYAIISPIYNSQGQKVGYSAVRQDITNKKKLAAINQTLENKVLLEREKNTEQNKQLLQQSRLANMGEMIRMIAHQWRQPLNAISLTANNLSFKIIIDELDKAFFAKELALIDNYSQHLSKTIDDFRTFFQKDKVKDGTSLNILTLSVLDIVKPALENKNIIIITDLACNEEIQTYPTEVKQVILNIIQNAEDALLDRKVLNPTISILSKLDGGECILVIKDNAGGIAEDIIDKIFDPYFSTKKEKDGTGLGLYMSKTIIEDHCGGKLHVQNNEDGAVFSIQLGETND